MSHLSKWAYIGVDRSLCTSMSTIYLSDIFRYIICHLSLRSISIKPTHGDISTCGFLQGKASDIPDSIRAHQNEAFRIRRQILLAELPSGRVKLAMTGQLYRALLKRVVEGWNPSVDHHTNHNTGLQFLLVVPKP